MEEVTRHYLKSGVFNGYSVYALKKGFNIGDEAAKDLLRELISDRKIDVVFGNIHPNPYIKAFSDTTVEEQIKFLETLDFSEYFCLYPTERTLANIKEKVDNGDNVCTEQLALGGGQLDFRVFDLSVLEYYRNDPRYYYQTNFINGQISVTNEY